MTFGTQGPTPTTWRSSLRMAPTSRGALALAAVPPGRRSAFSMTEPEGVGSRNTFTEGVPRLIRYAAAFARGTRS